MPWRRLASAFSKCRSRRSGSCSCCARRGCPAAAERLPLSVAEAIHQRLLLAAVDLDHRPIDEMREIGSEVGDKAGDLFAFGNPTQWDAARGKRVRLLVISMSRAIASTRPAQRSVRTGPGLTATKLILSLPYCAASASVKFCPAAFAAPGAISQ